jgi:hypothetical protein
MGCIHVYKLDGAQYTGIVRFDLYRLPDVFAKRSEQSGGKYGVFKREE